MRFCIGELEYFNSLGFDTEHWRKSVDGTKALVHASFALVVCDENKLDIYNHNSSELKEILNSEEWTHKEEKEQ